MSLLFSDVVIKDRWARNRSEWEDCSRCSIHESCLKKSFGRGKLPCKVMFIGDAPGPKDHELGIPFQGPSGKLFDQLLARASSQAKRKPSYFLTTLISCFPDDGRGGYRNPTEEEIQNCSARLENAIWLALPKAIVWMGKAAQAVGKSYRKKVNGLSLILPENQLDLYHPSYILRQGGVGSLEWARAVDSLSKLYESIL